MTDPHTPLPWSFVPWHIEEGSPAVRAPAGYLVTTTASDADAAFIVKAVNNHDALVKALERINSASFTEGTMHDAIRSAKDTYSAFVGTGKQP